MNLIYTYHASLKQITRSSVSLEERLHQQKGVSCYGRPSYMTYIVYHDQICILWQKTY